MLFEGNESNDGSTYPILGKPEHQCKKCGEETREAEEKYLKTSVQ